MKVFRKYFFVIPIFTFLIMTTIESGLMLYIMCISTTHAIISYRMRMLDQMKKFKTDSFIEGTILHKAVNFNNLEYD